MTIERASSFLAILCHLASLERFLSLAHGYRSLIRQQSRRLALLDFAACDLECRNGGLCAWISTVESDVYSRVQRGEPVQECVCQPGYGGVGCEVSLDLCPELFNARDCACVVASRVSFYLSESYCTTTVPQVEYCSLYEGQVSSNMSAVPLLFCVNGGTCSKSSLGRKENVFQQSTNDCTCPVEFDGPHCEFLRYDKASHGPYNGGDDDGLTSHNRTQSRVDDMIDGALIRDDDQLLDGVPTAVPYNPRIQTRLLWILVCLAGFCLLALSFVLCRKRSRRKPDCREAEQAPEIMPPVSLRNHPSETTHITYPIKMWFSAVVHSKKFNGNSPTSMLDVPRESINEYPAKQEAAPTESDEIPDRARNWRALFGYSEAQSVLPIVSTGQLLAPSEASRRNGSENTDDTHSSTRGCLAIEQRASGDEDEVIYGDDDEEILVGTFDSYVLYGPVDMTNCSQSGALPYSVGLLSDTNIDTCEPANFTISQAPTTSAFSTFQGRARVVLDKERDFPNDSLLEQAEDGSLSVSSYCSAEWSQSFLDASRISQPRTYDSYSPDSLYTSTTERESDTLKYLGHPSASLSDYSSFSDTATDGISISTTLDGCTHSSEDASSATSLTVDWSGPSPFARSVD